MDYGKLTRKHLAMIARRIVLDKNKSNETRSIGYIQRCSKAREMNNTDVKSNNLHNSSTIAEHPFLRPFTLSQEEEALKEEKALKKRKF